MAFAPTLGSLSVSSQLQAFGTQLREKVNEHAAELATGRVQNPARHLAGNIGELAIVESAMRRNEAESRITALALDALSGVQTSLGHVTALMERNKGSLMTLVGVSASDQEIAQTARAAALDLQQMISALSASQSGRSLFSGAASDQPPLPDAEVLLQAAANAIPANASAAETLAALDSFFALPGGDFALSIYSGDESVRLTPVAPGLHMELPTALHPAIVGALRDATLTAILDHPDATIDPDQRSALAALILQRQLQSIEGVIGLRGELGSWEAVVSDRDRTLKSEHDMGELRRNALVGTDPYLAANRLEEARTQLEALYLVTARVARLSLTEYLR